MKPDTQLPNDVPTALPGFEDEDAREKLLLEATGEEPDLDSDEDEEAELLAEKGKPKKRRWQIMRTAAAFGVFVCVLIVAVTWFFGMGPFAEARPQPVSRNGSKDAPATPVTGDEKLKMALSMIAAEGIKTGGTSSAPVDPEATTSMVETNAPGDNTLNGAPPDNSGIPMKASSTAAEPSFSVPPSAVVSDKPQTAVQQKDMATQTSLAADSSAEPSGRSLFFGVTKKPPVAAVPERSPETRVPSIPVKDNARKAIPFGTMLPVRLVGSIYTLRNSSGIVRLELTRGVEVEGYSYPAGTTVIGNVRGGESIRAFVSIVGLIDPVSGELVKFGGELLGKDGASGIEGKKRRLTSQWARFLSGLKETASSVLSSVGAMRSGGTVILSEPIRKGSESMSEDLSEALLKNGKENTFLEVMAGSNGYVLVTDLPDASTSRATELKPEAFPK